MDGDRRRRRLRRTAARCLSRRLALARAGNRRLMGDAVELRPGAGRRRQPRRRRAAASGGDGDDRCRLRLGPLHRQAARCAGSSDGSRRSSPPRSAQPRHRRTDLSLRLSARRLGAARRRRIAQVDQQLRHADPHLCDARLGAQHRRRPRRPPRSRLCRLLCGRRLCLCAAVDRSRPLVLDLPAARRHFRFLLGAHSRLSGAAPARRLPRHRHARLRRDHPPRADQLDRRDQWQRRHRLDPAHHFLRPSLRRRRQLDLRRISASPFRRSTARSFSII